MATQRAVAHYHRNVRKIANYKVAYLMTHKCYPFENHPAQLHKILSPTIWTKLRFLEATEIILCENERHLLKINVLVVCLKADVSIL